jgi:PAS domain S-box-containing protein
MELLRDQTFNHALGLSYKQIVTQTPVVAFVDNDKRNKKTIAQLRSELDKVNLKYNAVFNSSNAYYIILNKQLNIIDFNRAYVCLMGAVSKKHLKIGENITTYIKPGEFTDMMQNCKRALAGKTVTVERKIHLANNQSTWWLVEYSPAYSVRQVIEGIVVNVIDITHRKNHEIKIELQNKRLRDISLMQSHDIRGPLCTLMGLMELLKMEGIAADSGYLPMMDATIALLDKKVRSIVDFASDKEDES